jgi:hypothetical protein
VLDAVAMMSGAVAGFDSPPHAAWNVDSTSIRSVPWLRGALTRNGIDRAEKARSTPHRIAPLFNARFPASPSDKTAFQNWLAHRT